MNYKANNKMNSVTFKVKCSKADRVSNQCFNDKLTLFVLALKFVN